MEKQNWWQTISLIITMLGIGAFIWLNIPTKQDLKQYATKQELQTLRVEMNARLDKMNAQFDKINARFDELNALMDVRFDKLEAIMTIQRDEIKGIRSDLRAHTQNYDIHAAKQSAR